MTAPALDLTRPRAIHVVGVGGAGMSGIAHVLARQGHRVSGSDLRDSVVLDRLRADGVDTRVGHAAVNVGPDVEIVVISTAVPRSNPEVVEAQRRDVPVLRRAEVLAALTALARTVAISGTHGKTTTSSMVALVLRAAGWKPSFLIGGDLNELGSNALQDEGEWLVVEADESDGTFTELDAEAVVVTNVEADHLDHHGTLGSLEASFERFLQRARRVRVVCADDPGVRRVVERADVPVVTYGTVSGADVRIADRLVVDGGSIVTLEREGRQLGTIELVVPGAHNALNAAAVATLGLELGVPFEAIAEALHRFTGVQRRFQFRGLFDGITVVDDYAHHPTEVRAVLAAAREGVSQGRWRRVVAVFQPHRYSRTEALWQEFGDAFADADVVVLTDVYAAGEVPRPGVTGRLVLQALLDRRPNALVAYSTHRADLARHVRGLARSGDLVLSLGAGDVTALADEWALAEAEPDAGAVR